MTPREESDPDIRAVMAEAEKRAKDADRLFVKRMSMAERLRLSFALSEFSVRNQGATRT